MKPDSVASKIRVFAITLLVLAAVFIAIFAFPRPVMAPEPEETLSPSPSPSLSKTEEAFIDAEPSPSVRAAFIPDPDELQQIPTMSQIKPVEGYLKHTFEEGKLTVSWAEQKDSDYSVLCVLDEDGAVLQQDILWAEITQWEFPDFEGTSVLLLCYQDMGEDRSEDDNLTGSYILHIAPEATPAPDPTSGNTKQIPKPEAKKNKYYIIVDKADHSFAVFTYDENGEYTDKVITFPCAVGRSSKMTPNGKFKISSKGPWKKWSSGHYSPYYTRYTDKNKVGLYFHGAVYKKKDRSTMMRDSYEEIGTNASAGCIRTTYAGARWVYANCPAGTVVEIVKSSDLVGSASKKPIDENYPTWDPTDPDKPSGPAKPSTEPSMEPPVEPSTKPSDSSEPSDETSESAPEGSGE